MFESIPDATQLYPIPTSQRVMFVANLDLPPNVHIGAYTYYDDPSGPEGFFRNILYHFDFTGDQLFIGKFCSLATNTKFLMNGGNHRVDAVSSYPFMIMGGDWQSRFEQENDFPTKGDTHIGNDVWTGWNTTIMPGVTVGDGVIIGSSSVVTKDIPPYAIVGGNPAKIIRMRHDDQIIAKLLEIKWWDWPIQQITEHLPAISGTDVQALLAID